MNFEQLFTGFQSIRVAILGDVMLDTYWWGSVDRISPEAPVPVVALKNKELRVGGAANVALNTASLGAKTTMISIVGADTDGEQLLQLLNDKHIDTSYIRSVSSRVTTNKTRIMSRNQQMMRLDAEITTDIDEATENMLIEQVKHCLDEQHPQVLIFEDYNKGVITERIIQNVTALCKERNVIIAVDPKKKNFLSYKDVTIFKPNLKEVKEGLNLSVDHIDLSSLQQIHQRLQ